MVRSLYLLLVAGLVAVAAAGTVTITNGTGGYDIYNVYISPSSADEWGDDWLGSEIMYDGDSWEFDVRNGTWDFRLIDEDGDEYILYGVPIQGEFSWYVTLDDLGEYNYTGDSGYVPTSGSCPITIYNDLGNYDIWYVQISSSNYSEWGEDWLGESEILSPGYEVTFYVEPGTYDIRLTDEDDDTYTRMGIGVGRDGYYWAVDLGDLD
jgi:hypothetical protein